MMRGQALPPNILSENRHWLQTLLLEELAKHCRRITMNYSRACSMNNFHWTLAQHTNKRTFHSCSNWTQINSIYSVITKNSRQTTRHVRNTPTIGLYTCCFDISVACLLNNNSHLTKIENLSYAGDTRSKSVQKTCTGTLHRCTWPKLCGLIGRLCCAFLKYLLPFYSMIT